MPPKLIRITTVPLSLEKLLEGQLTYMGKHYEVTAISAEKERLEKFGIDNGVKTYHVEMTREITPLLDLKGVIKLYWFLKKERPLIVHTHTPKAGIIGMMAAWMAGVPIRLHTVAGMPLMETSGTKRKILEQVEKLTYRFATKVYPNSNGLKEIILEENFTSGEKLRVLGKGSSNGIDTNYFDPSLYIEGEKTLLKKNLGIPEDDLVFVFIGRLVSEKGINELVMAFNELQAQEPKISLLLVGPFEEKLDPLSASSLKLIEEHPKIITTGYQIDVRSFLSISDVLTFPSYREGFPNVVLQAGAMGLPAIVSDINGCNEIITEGINGIIIPVKNKEALGKAMKRILQDKRLREKLALSSRDIIVSDYQRSHLWQLLLKDYKSYEQKVSNV